jgi:hypothetical protein
MRNKLLNLSFAIVLIGFLLFSPRSHAQEPHKMIVPFSPIAKEFFDNSLMDEIIR